VLKGTVVVLAVVDTVVDRPPAEGLQPGCCPPGKPPPLFVHAVLLVVGVVDALLRVLIAEELLTVPILPNAIPPVPTLSAISAAISRPVVTIKPIRFTLCHLLSSFLFC
jgi:hypothetical protein